MLISRAKASSKMVRWWWWRWWVVEMVVDKEVDEDVAKKVSLISIAVPSTDPKL